MLPFRGNSTIKFLLKLADDGQHNRHRYQNRVPKISSDATVGGFLGYLGMSTIKLDIKKNATFEEAAQTAKAAGVNSQGCLEVMQCWDMLQIWKDQVTARFGEIIEIRKPRNDPPDVELEFDSGTIIGMEHTQLLRKHIGEAEAWAKKWGQPGGIPSIATPPKNKDEQRDIVLGIKARPSNVLREWLAVFELLAVRLREKMRGMPNGGIIGIVCELFIKEEDDQQVAWVAHNIVNRDQFADFGNFTLFLLKRATQSTFYSALVRRGEDILERRGTPPPLSAEDQKMLARIRAFEAELDAMEPDIDAIVSPLILPTAMQPLGPVQKRDDE